LGVTDGGPVEQFHVLVSGYVTAEDYVSNPTLVAGQTEWNPLTYNSKMVIVVNQTSNIVYDETFATKYVDKLIPNSIEYKII
jgi:hypothetical protein